MTSTDGQCYGHLIRKSRLRLPIMTNYRSELFKLVLVCGMNFVALVLTTQDNPQFNARQVNQLGWLSINSTRAVFIIYFTLHCTQNGRFKRETFEREQHICILCLHSFAFKYIVSLTMTGLYFPFFKSALAGSIECRSLHIDVSRINWVQILIDWYTQTHSLVDEALFACFPIAIPKKE